MLRALAGAALVVGLLTLIFVLGRAWKRARAGGKPWSIGDTTGVAGLLVVLATSGFGVVAELPDSEPGPILSSDLYSLEGFDPRHSPERSHAIGFIALGDDPSLIRAELGEPDEVGEDEFLGGAPTETWRLRGGGQVTATHVLGPPSIVTLRVEVRENGPNRFALDGGLVLGVSTLADFFRAWGRPTQFATSSGADFVASYSRCDGKQLTWLKLDQRGRGERAYEKALDNEVVTSVLAFYPDDRPGDCRRDQPAQ